MSPSEIPLWAALPAALLLVAGGLLALIGSVGLLRLPTFQARMHAPTMGNTLGLACVLVASLLVASAIAGRLVLQELLIALFVVLTSPVTALLLMQAAQYRDRVDRRGDGPAGY
ncbi:MAG: monovalent cation/H(+) antiporter subunit G [Burkholderiaceae bacterium]